MKGAGVARGLGALLAVGLLATVVVLAGLERGQPVGRGSVAGSGAQGWRALYLLFEELGLRPEPWSGALAELPAGRHALWWGRAPQPEQALEPRNRPASAAPRAQDAHDRWLEQGDDAPPHLRRFLVQGGRLFAPPTAATLDWLVREAGLVELEGARFEPRERAAGPARGAGGERFELAALRVQALLELPPDAAREVLLAEADGEPLALEIAIGRGSVVFAPSETLFDNAVLREGDAALLAVRLAEGLAPGGRLLFDERLQARGETLGLGALLAGPTLRLASLNAALLALLALWAALAPREFAREPRRSARVSALERARARAHLALRAGHAAALAAPLRAGVLRRAARRLRVRLPAGEADPAERFAELEAAAGARFDRARWTRAWTRTLPDDPAALAELDLELRALESGLSAPQDARPEPGAEARRRP